MTAENVCIADLTETCCKDTAVYNSGECVILQSGAASDRYAVVLFVVQRSLEGCIQTFTPIAARVATLTLHTTGGSLSVVLTYLPYEVPESQELRVAAYDIYAQVVGEAQKRGPVLGLGDHTTSVRCTILN